MVDLLREERLGLWDRLLGGECLDGEELERSFGPLMRSVHDAERENGILLIAAVHLFEASRLSARRQLMAALRYWWSKTGSKGRPNGFCPTKLGEASVLDVMGLHLTWEEALQSVGIRQRMTDHKALHRITEKLAAEYRAVWKRVLGTCPETETPPDGR